VSFDERSHNLLVVFGKNKISESVWHIDLWLFDFLDQVNIQRIFRTCE
jgi:hypothetical protein